MAARVVLVGRPNVGKSTLFNRLLGHQQNIVEPTPGVTRDVLEGSCSWSGRTFTLLDTGGVLDDARKGLEAAILSQVDRAVRHADLILLVTSVKDGVTGEDEAVARRLRRLAGASSVVVVANKADNPADETHEAEMWRLGFGGPIAVSAAHGRGIGELLDEIARRLEGHQSPLGSDAASEREDSLRLCVIGRPNVGKSSLVNALLGEPRVVVHEDPGTTRDAVNTTLAFEGQGVALIDTAGLRKRSRATNPIEFYSRTRTVKSIMKSDVALLVLEAPEGVLAQDKKIAGEVHERGKGMLILANKWDRLPRGKAVFRDYVNHVRRALSFVSYAPILPVSALTGTGLESVLPQAIQVYRSWKEAPAISEVSKVIREAALMLPPPSVKGKRLRLKAVSPIRTSPPTFLIKTNAPGKIPDRYLQYLEGKLREAFDLNGTPIRFAVRGENR